MTFERTVENEDLEALASFFDLDPEEARRALLEHDPEVVSAAWRDLAPETDAEVQSFFTGNRDLIFSHLQWHLSGRRDAYWKELERLVREFPPSRGFSRVLDYGAGIGTDALFLAEHGYQVTLVDVDGPMFQFARQRFARRNLEAQFKPALSSQPELDQEFDVVIVFDVLEHLPDPLRAARALIKSLRLGGVMLESTNFVDVEDVHPEAVKKGIRQFAGAAWRRFLAGYGMRELGPLMLLKVGFPLHALFFLRHVIWRTTGMWVRRPRV